MTPVRSGRLLATTLGLALLVALGAAPATAAATVRWGTAAAEPKWGSGVTFTQVATLGGSARRVELVVASPQEEGGALVADLGPAAAGQRTLEYTVSGEEGGLLPNTTLSGRWRITWDDGTTTLGPTARATYRDTRFDWRTLRGTTVAVHWYRGGDAFGRRALEIAERSIGESARLLGVEERDRVDFFIYADESDFYDALGPATRENVGGQAIPSLRTLFALITPAEIEDRWVGIVIPHELAHLVFDTAVRNPYHYPPTWLNEGLAVYLAQGFDASDRADVRGAVGDGSLMPLSALTGQFPTTRTRFSLAYSESVSAIDFLVRTYGSAALVSLVRSYADGVSDEEAFTAALGTDPAAFEAAWLADLGAPAPIRHGPTVPPAGPLPSGWAAADDSSGTGEAVSSGDLAPSGSPGATERPSSASAEREASVRYALIWLAGSGLFLALFAGTLLRRRARARPRR